MNAVQLTDRDIRYAAEDHDLVLDSDWTDSPEDLGEGRCFCDNPDLGYDIEDGDYDCCSKLDCDCWEDIREERVCERPVILEVRGHPNVELRLSCQLADEVEDWRDRFGQVAYVQLVAEALRGRNEREKLRRMREREFGPTDPVEAIRWVAGEAA